MNSLQREARTRIAEVLNSMRIDDDVLGAIEVTGYESQPYTISPLDAWPRWERTQVTTRCIRYTLWNVFLVLPPADSDTYIRTADVLSDAAGAALAQIGPVQQIVPASLALDTQGNAPVPAVQIDIQTTGSVLNGG